MISDILSTQAILIANPNVQHQNIVDMIKLRLDGYITATKYVLMMYNVSIDLLDAAMAISPGKRSPTVTALDDGISKAVSSLVSSKDVNTIMDKLHAVGATDILVLDLANSRM